MAHSVFQKWLDIFPFKPEKVFGSRQPLDSKNGSFPVTHVLAHNSTYSYTYTPAQYNTIQRDATQDNTPPHTTLRTPCTRHTPHTQHTVLQRHSMQAQFTRSGARSGNWPRPMHSVGALRCRCVAVAVVAAAACWMRVAFAFRCRLVLEFFFLYVWWCGVVLCVLVVVVFVASCCVHGVVCVCVSGIVIMELSCFLVVFMEFLMAC